MRLYSGSTQQFIEDTTQNQIADKLKLSYFNYFRYNPSPSEVNSWRNSLRAISLTFSSANLMDHGVILEYQLPMTSKRMDCIICGKDTASADNAIIIELKQWEKCADSTGDNEVMTFIGGREREVLHPSVQVDTYRQYLQDMHSAFYEGPSPIKLNACSYLHNYSYDPQDVLFSHKFKDYVDICPLFTASDVTKFKTYLSTMLEYGSGLEVLKRVEQSKLRPSKKLMDHVGTVIKGMHDYILLDEQLVVFDRVLSCAREGFHDKQKSVIIVRGGPGTGKSVIAINLMAELLLNGYNAQYATGSKAFTETLRKIIGTRGSIQFKYTNNYVDAQYNEIDVLIVDEAHRIRKVTSNRFTPKNKISGKTQIEELIDASKVSVFFIDDDQIVRPAEIGSTTYIKEYAIKNNCKIYEYELESQFRCNGSDGFVNWINNTLGISRTANVLWGQNEDFDFKIYNDPFDLEKAIKEKVGQGFTGRITAGFCWPWSDPNGNGDLVNDIKIGDFMKPWNAKPDAGRLNKEIPKASLWAYDPNGINQVGCIYTAQGFEFDYVGVIFGDDLVYNFDKQEWLGHKENSEDSVVKKSKDQFTDLVKNTYRVLLSRGIKGCYVFFMDKDTERFFKSRMEKNQ
jgi:hypothetical protein